MKIDSRKLSARVRDFLDEPQSRPIWNELTNSILFNLIGNLIMFVIGLIMICTLVLAKDGLLLVYESIKNFVTLKVFQDPRYEYRENPDRIRPIILSCIIAGPNGHALMLGSLSDRIQQDTSFLARKANEFAEIYEDLSGRGEGTLFEMLQDDIFRPWRRRAVPESDSEGQDLILFDAEYEKEKLHRSGKSIWMAAIITIDEKRDDESFTDAKKKPPDGRIVQIPWDVVGDAISDH